MANARPVRVGEVPAGVTEAGNGANDALYATVDRNPTAPSGELDAGPNICPKTGAYLKADYRLDSGAIRQDR